MLWPDLIPRPLQYCLRLIGLWPGQSNMFSYPFYALLSIISLIFQFWNTKKVYHDLESLIATITDIILILSLFLKTTIFWRQRWCVKDVLNEMFDDWYKAKSPEEIIVINNNVKFSQKFFATTFIVYNFTIFSFLVAAFRPYFSESVENRLLPIQASFPFSSKISPFYEITSFIQSYLLILVGIGFCVTDSSYVAMVLHASTKIEMMRFELDRFLEDNLKSKNRSAAKVLIEKHLNVIQFTKKVEQIYSGQLFVHFFSSVLQICLEGFTYLMTLSDSSGISDLLKNTLFILAELAQIGTYCVIGEHLQTKNDLVAKAAYLLPWYKLGSSGSKTIIMFIQRAQKPLSIRAGKIIVVSHFTLVGIIKLSVSYLSVLRAMRV